MGILDGFVNFQPKHETKLEAQYAPQIMGENLNSIYNYVIPTLTRKDAMSIPAVARCRNLIAGTVADTPLHYYKKSTGAEVGNPLWLDQPSLHQPLNVTLAWTVDSLIFYGVAYWEVTSTYAEDGRPASFEWVPNTKVTFDTDLYTNYVKTYYVDGIARPMDGVGSLVTFQSFNEGLLNYGGRLLQTALDVHEAARIAAATPMPSGYIKNSGADLPPNEVQGLLAAWKSARKNRSTAYLTSTLDYTPTSFSPKEMGYNEQIQNLATEIARAMNVPAYLLSAEQNSSMTYANVLDEKKNFYTMSLAPYYTAIEKRLSMNDLTTAGHEVRFAVDDTLLRADALERITVLEKMLALGLISVEQAMEMEDLTPNGNTGM